MNQTIIVLSRTVDGLDVRHVSPLKFGATGRIFADPRMFPPFVRGPIVHKPERGRRSRAIGRASGLRASGLGARSCLVSPFGPVSETRLARTQLGDATRSRAASASSPPGFSTTTGSGLSNQASQRSPAGKGTRPAPTRPAAAPRPPVRFGGDARDHRVPAASAGSPASPEASGAQGLDPRKGRGRPVRCCTDSASSALTGGGGPGGLTGVGPASAAELEPASIHRARGP